MLNLSAHICSHFKISNNFVFHFHYNFLYKGNTVVVDLMVGGDGLTNHTDPIPAIANGEVWNSSEE